MLKISWMGRSRENLTISLGLWSQRCTAWALRRLAFPNGTPTSKRLFFWRLTYVQLSAAHSRQGKKALPTPNSTRNVSDSVPKRAQQVTEDKNVTICSNERVYRISRLLVIILAITLLVVPIVLLYLFESTVLRFSIIVVFILLFLCTLALCTRARNFEIFAATAA
jgi:beta-lactamase regulating signal transducer with metallopeptidase domain